MNTLKANITNINVTSIEHILYELNVKISKYDFFQGSTFPITIDLTKINFFDPYSLITLCLLLRYLDNYKFDITISLPHNPQTLNYLHRMGLFLHIPTTIKLQSLNKVSPRRSIYAYKESDVLLELTAIEKQKDIYQVMDQAVYKIAKILKTSLNYREKEISAFCTAMSETCQNIKDHSHNQGYVAVQKYHTHHNYVIIGVGDLGIGIKKSLAQRYTISSWAHNKAIEKALELGTSRLSERGKGLYIVRQLVEKYHGTFIIRSCSGIAKIDQDLKSYRTTHFPGTQIYIKLLAPSKARDVTPK